MPGPSTVVLPGAYQPAYGADTITFNITVTGTATRLGALITTAGGSGIPTHVDEMGSITNGPTKIVPYRHMKIQVPTDAANKVWMTDDNNTTPVAADGGPGFELVPGILYIFENEGYTRLRAKSTGAYPVDANSAFQLVAAGNQAVSVSFND